MAEIVRVNPSHLATLPTLEFPFNKPPSVWAPEKTVLRLGHGTRVPIFVWCYLERHIAGNSNVYNPRSLSDARVAALPQAIRRVSDDFRLRGAGPRTIYSALQAFGQFLGWIDNKEHADLFEPVLSDPDVALRALESFHRHLKGKIQAHTANRNSCVNKERAALQALSVIHHREYADEIKKLNFGHRKTTMAPQSEDVEQFVSTLTAIFDSACRVLESCAGAQSDGPWRLSLSTSDDSQVADLPAAYSRARLMELAAMTFAGLVICDSGANLAQIRLYEEPQDLPKQLSDPDRISLTQKVIKLRAGGKAVPVTMSALTFTRLGQFARIRHQIIELLGCEDIAPFFFKCEYKAVKGNMFRKIGGMDASAVQPISDYFLDELRKKVALAGAILPGVTLRQLRTHKQQHLVRHYGLQVAADAMGHTIATAIKSYCAAQEGVQANEIGSFMSSLHKTVVHSARNRSDALVSVPAGECTSHGNPEPSEPTPLIEPDCVKTEGCFFCEHFRVHADEEDLRKLLSCQNVLLRVGHLQGESAQADRLYVSVMERIELLLRELQKILAPNAYERIEIDIAAGNLTRYWAVKVQQLGLLGLITTSAQA